MLRDLLSLGFSIRPHSQNQYPVFHSHVTGCHAIYIVHKQRTQRQIGQCTYRKFQGSKDEDGFTIKDLKQQYSSLRSYWWQITNNLDITSVPSSHQSGWEGKFNWRFQKAAMVLIPTTHFCFTRNGNFPTRRYPF